MPGQSNYINWIHLCELGLNKLYSKVLDSDLTVSPKQKIEIQSRYLLIFYFNFHMDVYIDQLATVTSGWITKD